MGLGAYVAVSAVLFALGIVAIVTRRNIIYVLMGIEMILNAANINFVAFNRFGHHVVDGRPILDGQMFAIFTIILAAAEAAVALAIVLNVFHLFDSIKPSDADLLRE
ncbi:MAG: NADH-quinone oxidoreductase subunit K [Planctomycetota bacterium]|jgi:NADH-quinone oxidoreductase subunit K